MRIESKCKICGNIDEFEVPDSGIEKRRRGASIVEAFPEMTADRIRQLTESICPKCQEDKRNATGS